MGTDPEKMDKCPLMQENERTASGGNIMRKRQDTPLQARISKQKKGCWNGNGEKQ